MRKPVDLLNEAGSVAGTQGSGEEVGSGQESSYCAVRRELSFVINPSAELEVGEAISLRLSNPVEVLRGGEAIGILGTGEGKSMGSCMLMGYRMTGAILSFDLASRRGLLSISGAHNGEPT
jgi:hypothetical protein